jgi:hypothetical protein
MRDIPVVVIENKAVEVKLFLKSKETNRANGQDDKIAEVEDALKKKT